MIVIPAVDLRGGHCVQLVGGDYADERVRLEDPATVAREWARTGFSRLHVVDLDAATGRGSNRDVIRDILREATVPVQVGGGIRDEAQSNSCSTMARPGWSLAPAPSKMNRGARRWRSAFQDG